MLLVAPDHYSCFQPIDKAQQAVTLETSPLQTPKWNCLCTCPCPSPRFYNNCTPQFCIGNKLRRKSNEVERGLGAYRAYGAYGICSNLDSTWPGLYDNWILPCPKFPTPIWGWVAHGLALSMNDRISAAQTNSYSCKGHGHASYVRGWNNTIIFNMTWVTPNHMGVPRSQSTLKPFPAGLHIKSYLNHFVAS